jgi:hypothetical protein
MVIIIIIIIEIATWVPHSSPATPPPFSPINPCASSNPSGVQMDTFEEAVVLFWVT